MKFGNNSSYTTLFFGVFFGALIIVSSFQALFGVVRWYNSSEESHEKLAPEVTYVVNHPEKQRSIFFGHRDDNQENPNTYFAAHSDDINNALATIPPEKASKINVRIVATKEIISPKIDVNQSDNSGQPDIFQSPVKVQINPENLSFPSGYLQTINTIITGKYFRESLWGFPIIVDPTRVSPRGQMSNESIILSGKVQSLSEVGKVLVHELGHMVDIYILRQKGLTPDPSKKFYDISWSEPTVMLSGMSSSDFVSGYSASNQYEDFAESFTMYIFHNKTFRERALKNQNLQSKYDFLKIYIFGDFFLDSSYEKDLIPKKLWDVTKIVVRTNTLSDIFLTLRGLVRQIV